MRKRVLCSLLMALALLALCSQTVTATTQPAEGERPLLVYFSVNACETCAELEKEMAAMQASIAETGKPVPRMEVFNIAEGPAYNLMMAFFDLYEVPENERNTPAMFIGDQYYIGREDVLSGIKTELARDVIPPTRIPGEEDGASAEDVFSGMTALNVFLVGLVNGFNPCSLSMLLFLFSLLLVKNIRVLHVGLAFGVGKLVMYLALGTLLYGVLSLIDATVFNIVIKAVMAVFILIVVILNVRDFFMARSERYDQVKNQLPSGLRKRNHAIISKITDVKNKWLMFGLAVVLGMAIAVGEFLCTGQMYVATITLVLQDGSGLSLQAFLYLLIYALAFMIPLIVLTIIIDRGKALFDVSEKLRKHLPTIKLITAILLVIMGVVYIVWL